MSGPYPIITITRNIGSNGRTIGSILARELQLPFYDNQLIQMAARESKFDPQLFQTMEETHASNSFLFAMSRLGAGSSFGVPLSDQLFNATADVIVKIADNHPAVIVGRCADYILRNHTRTVNIFIQADDEFRIRSTMERLQIGHREAESYNRKHDRSQAAYHNFYAEHKFGEREYYDLILNTTNMDPHAAAKFLARYVELVLGEELVKAREYLI